MGGIQSSGVDSEEDGLCPPCRHDEDTGERRGGPWAHTVGSWVKRWGRGCRGAGGRGLGATNGPAEQALIRNHRQLLLQALGGRCRGCGTDQGQEGNPLELLTKCPKCGKASWRPYRMRIQGGDGQVYEYNVYRHPDGRRKTPRKHTVKVEDPVAGT